MEKQDNKKIIKTNINSIRIRKIIFYLGTDNDNVIQICLF